MRFRFRLEKILEFRRGELDRKRMQLAGAQEALRQAEANLSEIRHARQQQAARDASDEIDGWTSLRLQTRLARCQAFVQQEMLAQDALRAAQQRVTTWRAEVLQARRAVRMLERLRERRRRAHELEVSAQERAETDDINGRRARMRPDHPATRAPHGW